MQIICVCVYTCVCVTAATRKKQQVTSYCVKAGHAEARRSIFDVEEEEDMDQPHDAVKGTPTPGAGADVWLL